MCNGFTKTVVPVEKNENIWQKRERKESQTSHKGILIQAGKSFIQALINLYSDKPEWEKGVAQDFLNHSNLI